MLVLVVGGGGQQQEVVLAPSMVTAYAIMVSPRQEQTQLDLVTTGEEVKAVEVVSGLVTLKWRYISEQCFKFCAHIFSIRSNNKIFPYFLCTKTQFLKILTKSHIHINNYAKDFQNLVKI